MLAMLIFSVTIVIEKINMEVADMLQTTIFKEDWEVGSRLSMFGVTKAELVTVVEKAVGARADAVPHDPVTAPGTFSYIYGTRGLRDLFASQGWIPDSTKGIESIYHPITGTKLIFQNVDSACDDRHPKAISGKGMASEEIISLSTKYLFEDMEEQRQKMLNGTAWFLCVYANGEDVRAELSLPLGVKEGQFSGFIERIFLLNQGEWKPFTISRKEEYPLFQDFDIPVTRK
jgi:hypothetical protein